MVKSTLAGIAMATSPIFEPVPENVENVRPFYEIIEAQQDPTQVFPNPTPPSSQDKAAPRPQLPNFGIIEEPNPLGLIEQKLKDCEIQLENKGPLEPTFSCGTGV